MSCAVLVSFSWSSASRDGSPSAAETSSIWRRIWRIGSSNCIGSPFIEAHPNTNMTLTEATEKPATKPLLEVWGRNEVMRHVPSLEWLVWKVDHDLRRRIEKLYAAVAALPHDDPRRGAIDEHARALCRAIDRLAETARHTRINQPPNDLGERLSWPLNPAVSCLTALDPTLFGRRQPFHTFERSKSEPLYGALVAV